MDEKLPYFEEYNEFISKYKERQVSAEEVGQVIARMAQYFGQYNFKLVSAEKRLYVTASDIMNRTDELTSKPITGVKAEALINATEEHFGAEQAKAHVQNIEQFINALKSLQKGILQEYAHSGI